MVLAVVYILIGFTVTSLITRFFPGEVHDPRDKGSTLFLFAVLIVFWPIVAVYWILKLPIVLLLKYIAYLDKLGR